MARTATNAASFGGNFLQAFTAARERKDAREMREKLLDVQISLAKKQLDDKIRQEAKFKSLIDMLSPKVAPLAPEGEEPGEAEASRVTPGLDPSKALQDPEFIANALGSGQLNIGSLLTAQRGQAQQAQTAALLRTAGVDTGGGIPAADTGLLPAPGAEPTAAPAPGGAPSAPRLQLENVVATPRGLNFKLSPRGPGAKVVNTRLDPTNPLNVIEEDAGRNVVRIRPASPDELDDLDKPAKPATLNLFETITDGKGTGRSPQGLTLRQLQGDPGKYRLRETKLPVSDATRLNLMNQGVGDLEDAKKLLFDENGEIRTFVLFQMAVNVGEGLEVNSLIFNGVAGLILAISGVAVRPEERENVMDAFVPSIRDLTSPGFAKRKMERFQRLLEGNIDAVMGNLPATLQDRIRERRDIMKITITEGTGLTPEQQRRQQELREKAGQ